MSAANFVLAVYTCEIDGCCDSYFWQIQDEEGNAILNSAQYTNKAECRRDGKEVLLSYRSAGATEETNIQAAKEELSQHKKGQHRWSGAGYVCLDCGGIKDATAEEECPGGEAARK